MTAAVAIGASYGSASGSLIELEASNHLGMRWLCRTCDPVPLNFMTINWGEPEHNRGFEDRTFLVYDLSSFDDPDTVEVAILNIGLQNQDPGGPVGIIDISTDWLIAPDIPPDAFWWGEFRQSFEVNTSGGMFHVDVTDFIREGLHDGTRPFAFLRLSTETLDRYAVGPSVGFPVPTLTVTIPEPPTVCFFLLTTLILLPRGDRRH
jgi:hypothetical protein